MGPMRKRSNRRDPIDITPDERAAAGGCPGAPSQIHGCQVPEARSIVPGEAHKSLHKQDVCNSRPSCCLGSSGDFDIIHT